MRKLPIAFGKSAHSKIWKNDSITFDELCDRLKKTTYTSETVEEYQNLPKPKRDEIKDIGGFVAGTLKDGKRKSGSVENRSIILYDGDRLKIGFIEEYKSSCCYESCLYTTHSHTPASPRARLLIPLTRDVTPNEYVAIARHLANILGMEQFDECSYKVNQLMYFPSTPADGEYIFEHIHGEWLDPDKFLSNYPDWQDYSTLPMSPRETNTHQASVQHQEDPLSKPGIIGAFCRAYTIEDAIATFLPDVYAPSVVEGRYDYIKGEGSAGVIIYDDKFAYSHHATDPASCKLCNAFDLVRIHKFGEYDEQLSLKLMLDFANNDERVTEMLDLENKENAYLDFSSVQPISDTDAIAWEQPIPFDNYDLPPFPIEALPTTIGEYAKAVSETTQTPLDMAAASALPIIALCIQNKYIICGKADWYEPLNLFENIIAEPSERKSPVLKAMMKPVTTYEIEYNKRNAHIVEASNMRKRVLEKRQKAIEEQVSKGKLEYSELDKIAEEISNFEEIKPLKLYVDDITTEKLTSTLADNNSKTAIISSEGGIFNMLSGMYSKTVNIDVALKAYSGDTIRVDRIGRASESIVNPSLTMLIMVQPNVLSGMMQNKVFRGRGLTARFLYVMPKSRVGTREYRTNPIPGELYIKYESLIHSLLEEEQFTPQIITLSPEADKLLEEFSLDLEPKIKTEYINISEWIGKLAGNILRISGILCRCNTVVKEEFLNEPEPLIVSKKDMENAIKLGMYFTKHAEAAFGLMGADDVVKGCKYMLDVIKEHNITEFNCHDIKRQCRSFKTAEELKPVLERLVDYDYIIPVNTTYSGKGRPSSQKYLVNPNYLGN